MLYLARTLAALGLLIALSSAGAAPVATSIDSRIQKLEGKMEEMMVVSKSNEDKPKHVKEKVRCSDRSHQPSGARVTRRALVSRLHSLWRRLLHVVGSRSYAAGAGDGRRQLALHAAYI